VSTDWESRAGQWLAWARTPGHDAYWTYRDAFFALLPPSRGATLEVGCGEGRVLRDLKARGYDVIGLDSSATLLEAARDLDPDGRYVLGRAEELPFDDGSFELVVAYNVLMDVDDMPRAVAEIGRVLRPGGRLCACVTHPLTDAGGFEGDAFVIRGSYLEEGWMIVGAVEREGLEMCFDGRTYPLESYGRALEAAHLQIETLREPAAPLDSREGERWSRIPLFLTFRAVSAPG
jgi:SAM-dependent methyltransferase